MNRPVCMVAACVVGLLATAKGHADHRSGPARYHDYLVREAANRAQHRLPVQTVGPEAWAAANYAALGQPKWEIVHEDLTLELQHASKTVKATVLADVVAHAAGVSAIEVWAATGCKVSVPGEKMPIQVKALQTYGTRTRLGVQFSVPLAQELTVTLQFDQVAKPKCSGTFKGQDVCAFGQDPAWTLTGDHVIRSAEAQSRFSADLHIVASDALVAVATGEPFAPTLLPPGKQVSHFVQAARTPHCGFAVGAFQSWVLPGSPVVRMFATLPESNSPILKAIPAALAFYEDHYGPFGFSSLNVAGLGPEFGGGMSAGGFFVVGDTAFSVGKAATDYARRVVPHETAHQWWGNLVEPASGESPLVSESLAEFSECALDAAQSGRWFAARSNAVRYLYDMPPKDDQALASVDYGSAGVVPVLYYKGSVVFNMLRKTVGDGPFYQALKAVRETFAHDIIKQAQLRAAFEQAAGTDLAWFFQQWINGKGAIDSVVAVRYQMQAGQPVVRLKFAQTGKAKRFWIDVAWEGSDGGWHVVPVEIKPLSDGTATVEIATTQIPHMVRLDPEFALLRRFEAELPGDFDLNGEVDGRDLVELALHQGDARFETSWAVQPVLYNELVDANQDLVVSASDADAVAAHAGSRVDPF